MARQSRFLLTDARLELSLAWTGYFTAHANKKTGYTGRLIGTLLWLVSPASAFVTGTVIPVDGVFSAFSGV